LRRQRDDSGRVKDRRPQLPAPVTWRNGNVAEWILLVRSQSGQEGERAEGIAATAKYKLYRTGEFFDYEKDPNETKPLDVKSLDAGVACGRSLERLGQI
jgi:hypothetical protein